MREIKPPPSSSRASAHQPVLLFLASLPVWRKSSPLSRSLVCIPVDIHTHPLLQRNVSYFGGPKVSQTSSLFLMPDSLDHCVFVFFLLFWENAVCFDLQPQPPLFIYKEQLLSTAMSTLLESDVCCLFCQTQLDLECMIFQGADL